MRKYHLHYVKRDRRGNEVSRDIVGHGKWLPMTHKEAITARSKFTLAPEWSIELVPVVSRQQKNDPSRLTPAPGHS